MGDVPLSEMPTVSGRERYQQFLHPSFSLSSKAGERRTSYEMNTNTTATATTTTKDYTSTTTTSANSLKANSDTTSVSNGSYREQGDLDSTANLKGFIHAVHSRSDDGSVRTGTETGTGDLGPEQAVRSM